MAMKIFVYGSNIFMPRLAKRAPSVKYYSIGKLYGHQFKVHKLSKDGSTKANAFETGHENDVVIKVVYEIAENDKPKLDKAEGLGDGYTEKVVTIQLFDGKRIQAQTYLALEGAINDHAKPYTWYMTYVLVGASHFHLPHTYVTALSDIAVMIQTLPETNCMIKQYGITLFPLHNILHNELPGN